MLRLATFVPDGSTWGRELSAFAREVAQSSKGAVQIRWHFGGIAGDDKEVLKRIGQHQLDGVFGAERCSALAPSLLAFSAVGMFQGPQESSYVLRQLTPTFQEEALRAGFALLATPGLGPIVIFSRQPVQSMEELRSTRLWDWDLDPIHRASLRSLRLNTLARPLQAAAAAYRDGLSDGFLATPTAALAFQWSAQIRYLTDLRMGYLPGCIAIANRAFDPLPQKEQQILRAAAAKLDRRIEVVNGQQEELLLNRPKCSYPPCGIFAKQGLVVVPVADHFRAEFFSAAREARSHLPTSLVPREMMDRMLRMLADYRAEHQP